MDGKVKNVEDKQKGTNRACVREKEIVGWQMLASKVVISLGTREYPLECPYKE